MTVVAHDEAQSLKARIFSAAPPLENSSGALPDS